MKILDHSIAVVMLVVGPAAHAVVTVNYGAYPGDPSIRDAGGTPLADGNFVGLGTFTVGFDLASHADDLHALQTAWIQFDSTTIRHLPPFGAGEPGRFADSFSLDDVRFDNRTAYFWILKTVDNGAPDFATFANVQQYGIFGSTQSGWRFPSHDATPPSNVATWDTSTMNLSYFGSILPANGNQLGSLQLGAIPEPAAQIVMTASALALGAGIRRLCRGRSRDS